VRRLVPVIYSIIFLDAMLQFALVPLLPDYADELGLSKTQAGIVVATYSAVVLFVALPVGRLTDRIGARKLTIFGTALLAVSTAAFGLADGFETLLAARVGQGLSSAISWTAGLAWLAGAARAEERGKVLGASMAVGNAGALLGPVIAGPLGQWLGIRAPFLMFAGVATVLAVWSTMPAEARGRAQEAVSLRRLASLSKRSRPLAAGVLIMVVVAVVSGALETLVPLSLGSDHWTATEISIVLGLAGATGVIANLAVGRIYNRFGGISLGTAGLLGAAVASAVLVPPQLSALALAVLYVAGAPAISAQYAVSFPLAAEGAEEVGLPHGVVLGLINVCWGLGFTIGPAAGAAIAELTADGVTYALCAVLSLAAVPLLRSSALSGKECQQGA
jgi:DHA1 family L-arabinose/isopropyl-beta-D-thiogalactopyranoside export protein-like MFS transporter/DHA1 family inner membrane transport protein